MENFELNIKAAGAYILYENYFVFMFGHGKNHSLNELGIVRFGGHLEKNETPIQCVLREVQEEASLDLTFLDNRITYLNENNISRKLIIHRQSPNPIFVINNSDNEFSLMYLTYGKGTLIPKMETQGVIYLRKIDIEMICTKQTTLKEFKKNGGKFSLVKDLSEDSILIPHTQIIFLNDLFTLEKELMDKYMENKENN